jgi:S-adenosylmethionine-diacylglycerol 3-amino-3-carboxypropyl transferase
VSTYFQGLNYSLANEDTRIEHDLLPENAGSVFSVCGSGGRVLPLIAKNPGEVHVVDLSETQLKLFRLRYAAAQKLNRNEFLFLLGYVKDAPYLRADLLQRLKLSAEDEKFWKSQEQLWRKDGFIYLGKWERHFMKLGKFFRLIPGVNVAPLFEAKNLTEQKEILNRYWKPAFFKTYTIIVLNEWVSNKLLYKGSFAGGSKVKTKKLSTAEMVFAEFNDLFHHTHVRSNYFLNMIFLNHVSFPEAYPIECSEGVLEGVRKAHPRIVFEQQNLLPLLKQRPHDFYSLSDTFSYMQDEEVGSFLSTLPEDIPQGSKMVIRTFMRKPHFTISSPWKTDEKLNEKLAKKDCTRVYEFTVLKKS